MTAYSSILAWRILWTEEPGRLQSMGLQSWTQLKQLSACACMHTHTLTHTHTHAWQVQEEGAGILSCSLLYPKHLEL